ncbi:hypothetical protein GCM10009678_91850 [Actinomadura kijaniata]|uniref:Phage shock protein A n=1 Tax=Actinomadura namibiensis TaxID=182080 RepID=A0A7W3LT57_ACTNM|nr:PspA/IM30 family protein [Actinomadura namibiensis]MBA8953795.1 phage shock protein A [Actinomadura namibiensis]
MTKRSIVGRVAQLARADVHALLDEAEEPERARDRLVRDYADTIGEAERAAARTAGDLRLLEADHAEDVRAAAEWGRRALAASQEADRLRAAGDAADADRFDDLARVALERQLQAETEARATAPAIASQREIVDRLRAGVERMRSRLAELRDRRDDLPARTRLPHAAGNADPMDPISEVARFEQKLRREEERVRGRRDPAASPLDTRFETLTGLECRAEVEARLAALKAHGPAALAARSPQHDVP